MLKIKRKTLIPISSHNYLPFFSSSSSADALDFTNKISPEIASDLVEPSEPNIFYSFGPHFYISSLTKCKSLFEIKRFHARIVVLGMFQNLLVANKLLYSYVKCTAIGDANKLFGRMPKRNPVTWSVMIGGFANTGDYFNCLETFREFIRCGHLPDNYMLPLVIRVCRDSKDLKMGRLIHHVVYKFGLHLDTIVSAALMDLYAKCQEIEEARKVFDNMPMRDPVTWTVMIGASADCGYPNESFVLFDKMREMGVVPDKITMLTVVNACAKLGAAHKSNIVYEYICGGHFSLDVILGTALIDMHAKCGNIGLARDIFEMMRVKNVITWSAMIAAYGYHGLGQEALDLFPKMLSSGISPNKITFVSLLYACSHSGLVEEGLHFFSMMQDTYSLSPDVKHYTCMVDLFGRAGKLEKAMELIEMMGSEKDEGLWSALLGACRIHGNLEFAEKAARSLLELQPQNAGHYILLSNIYAKARKWEDMAKIRELMTHKRLKKIPGWTWIEVEDKIYRFGVGDRTHPRSKEVNEMLATLREKLELEGYVPDTDFVLHDVAEELKVQMLFSHSEKLAIAFGLLATPDGIPIRITKNLRVCGDCHTFCKLVSAITQRLIIVRDANRFHHFSRGICSCGDYW